LACAGRQRQGAAGIREPVQTGIPAFACSEISLEGLRKKPAAKLAETARKRQWHEPDREQEQRSGRRHGRGCRRVHAVDVESSEGPGLLVDREVDEAARRVVIGKETL